MPLFRRKQLDNAGTIAPPLLPQETIVNHYYSSSRVGTILALFGVGAVAAVLAWYGLVFLAEQAGFGEPARAVAECLLGIGVLLILLGGMGVVARFFLNDYLAHRERMAEKMVEMEKARSRAAQLIPPTTQARMTRDESRKYLAVKLVMHRAFEMVDEKGKLVGSKKEPWSRREVGQLTLMNEREPLGENSKIASWVKSYLLDRGVLVGDRQVDVDKFPNLATVEAQLVKDFGSPILFRAGDSGMSSHYIEKGTGRDSWGG